MGYADRQAAELDSLLTPPGFVERAVINRPQRTIPQAENGAKTDGHGWFPFFQANGETQDRTWRRRIEKNPLTPATRRQDALAQSVDGPQLAWRVCKTVDEPDRLGFCRRPTGARQAHDDCRSGKENPAAPSRMTIPRRGNSHQFDPMSLIVATSLSTRVPAINPSAAERGGSPSSRIRIGRQI